MRIWILVGLVLLPLSAMAAPPHREGIISSINIGARYSSTLARRGIELYDDHQIDPVLTVFALDDRVEFVGDSIGYRDFIAGDWLRFRTRLLSVTDEPLFPDKDEVRRRFPDRDDTVEWANGLELFLPGYNASFVAELDVHAYKDIDAHEGLYIESTAKLRLLQFELMHTLIEPDLVLGIGWGDKRHNRFHYGPDDDADGFTNVSAGLWIALPNDVDRFYPNLQLTWFRALGKHGDAVYARDHAEGVLFSFIAALRVL